MPDRLSGRIARLTLTIPDEGKFKGSIPATEVVIGADRSTDPSLRIQFKITRTDKKEPNTSEITVSNLSPPRRASLQRHGVKVLFEAGYDDTGLARYFLGDARTIDHVRDGPTWNTILKLGDGERAYRFARSGESFAAGTSAATVLKHLVGALGLDPGNSSQAEPALSRTFNAGYVVMGPVHKSLDRLLKSFGYQWSIQHGALQIVQKGASLPALIPEISPTSGLIGSPEMGNPDKKTGVCLCKFKMLLRPCIPRSRVRLKSERYDGEVELRKLCFAGDTHGGDWQVDAEGQLIK